MTVDTLLPRQRACDDPAGSWELVRRAQSGDRDAFADIYARYHAYIRGYLLRRLDGRHGRWETAEDLTSEVFARAIRRIGGFTWQGRDLGAWLVTIARNLLMDHLKCGYAYWETPNQWAGADPWDEHDVWSDDGSHRVDEPDCADLVVTRERDRALWRAVRDLDSQPQRRVIALRFLRGLSIEQTAALMGLTVGAVKALQYRATRALRRALAPMEVAG